MTDLIIPMINIITIIILSYQTDICHPILKAKYLNLRLLNMIAINKHSSKLKIWSVEMPNATYSGRYRQLTGTSCVYYWSFENN
jgi:hypothetical protein